MSKASENLKVATSSDVDSILFYLKEDVGNCLYMYIDIKKYGLSHPEMSVWFQGEGEKISLVVMKYYNSISFYSRETTWAEAEVVDLIGQYEPASVSAPLSLMEKIFSDISGYHLCSGWVFEYDKFKDMYFEGISHGEKEDLREIAQLLCDDQGFAAIYEVDNLHAQLLERMETGMGRNLIIRSESGQIVAQIATYAECDGIAITSGMIAHPDHRKSMYGTILESNIVKELKQEEFRVFTFVIEKKRKKLLDALKQKPVGQYGRLTRLLS